MSARVLLAMMALATLASAAPADDAHFLSFSRSAMMVEFRIEVHVGIRNRASRRAGEAPRAEDLWFSADASDRVTRRPLKWTEGGRCPAAVARLREVERLSGPSPRIPLAGGEPGGYSVRDGADYVLDVDAAVLDGQSTGSIQLSSNVNTSLAKWVEAMLVALQPCWSDEKPVGAP